MAVRSPGRGRVTSAVTPPTLHGWHLVQFFNGDVALVRWTGTHWAWGSLKHPSPSTIMSYTYLGPNIHDVGNNVTRFDNALKGLPARQAGELMALMDVGVTGQKGQPALVKPSGRTSKGALATGGDAVPMGLGTDTSTSQQVNKLTGGLLSGFSFLTSLSFWKGIGLVLAGAAILVFAALEFKGMS